MPAHGNPFVTQGYIYPAGTLSDTNGVLPDDSPEFPDKVLGEWSCRGWLIGDGAHSTTGPMVITTQVYNFGGEFSAATLTTDGYELADIDVTIQRAITGGTGPYADARPGEPDAPRLHRADGRQPPVRDRRRRVATAPNHPPSSRAREGSRSRPLGRRDSSRPLGMTGDVRLEQQGGRRTGAVGAA